MREEKRGRFRFHPFPFYRRRRPSGLSMSTMKTSSLSVAVPETPAAGESNRGQFTMTGFIFCRPNLFATYRQTSGHDEPVDTLGGVMAAI